MNHVARSVFVFGLYLVFLGATLVADPNLLLVAFGLPLTQEVWIRVVGVLVLCLALYYIGSGRRELTAFFGLTVLARAFVFVSFAAFAVLGLVKPMLVLFGAVDLLGAIWTAVAMGRARRSSSGTAPA